MTAPASGPLTGYRVLAFEQAVAMPYCSFLLAEMGADVIKVERPGAGDVVRGWDKVAAGISSGFVWVNANKRDIAVDASTGEGKALLLRLAGTAEVFVENYAPGTADRLGLGYEAVARVAPAIVYCSLSGYGKEGPYRNRKAYDLLIQGESGVLLTNGTPDEPAKVGLPITDLAGGMTAAIAIVAGLLQREQTGAGQHLDISMLDSMASWLGYFPHHSWHNGEEPPRTGMHHQYLCPYGPYLAADSTYVNLVVASERDWVRFAHDVLQDPPLAADPRFRDVERRRENRKELQDLVSLRMLAHPSRHWFALLEAAGLPAGEVRSIHDVLEHPQLLARQMFVRASSSAGALPLVRSPLGSPDSRRHIPDLGEDSVSLLEELDVPAEEAERLIRRGILAVTPQTTDFDYTRRAK